MIATCRIVGGAVIIRTLLDTLILQLIVICLTLGKTVVLFNSDFWRQAIIVCTIVSDIQTTVTIDKGQVTITVQTTRASCTQRNQVTVIDIVDRSCSITKHCGRVGIHGRRTR